MKTRIQIMIAAFALVLGTSLTAWSQQTQADESQKGKQQLASNHGNSDERKSSFAAGARQQCSPCSSASLIVILGRKI